MRGAIGAKAAISQADKRLPAQLPAHKDDRTKQHTTSLVPERTEARWDTAGKYTSEFPLTV